MRRRAYSSEARKALILKTAPAQKNQVEWKTIRVREDTFDALHRVRDFERMSDEGLGVVIDMLIDRHCIGLQRNGQL